MMSWLEWIDYSVELYESFSQLTTGAQFHLTVNKLICGLAWFLRMSAQQRPMVFEGFQQLRKFSTWSLKVPMKHVFSFEQSQYLSFAEFSKSTLIHLRTMIFQQK